jgi:hypothetical protein
MEVDQWDRRSLPLVSLGQVGQGGLYSFLAASAWALILDSEGSCAWMQVSDELAVPLFGGCASPGKMRTFRLVSQGS